MNDFSMGNIFFLLLMFIVFLLLLGIAFWLLTAIGLQMYAKKNNIDNTWLAWIPLAQNLYLLYIYDVLFKPKNKLLIIGGLSLLATYALAFFGIPIPILIFIIGYAMYWLFKRHDVNLVLQMVIMVITLGISIPFQLMLLSRRPVHHNYIDEVEDDIFDEPEF